MLMVLAPRENFFSFYVFDNRLLERFIYKSVMGERRGSSVVKTHFLKYGEIWFIDYNGFDSPTKTGRCILLLLCTNSPFSLVRFLLHILLFLNFPFQIAVKTSWSGCF
jgi:hypothetical protein